MFADFISGSRKAFPNPGAPHSTREGSFPVEKRERLFCQTLAHTRHWLEHHIRPVDSKFGHLAASYRFRSMDTAVKTQAR